jgi:hypothetical protein
MAWKEKGAMLTLSSFITKYYAISHKRLAAAGRGAARAMGLTYADDTRSAMDIPLDYRLAKLEEDKFPDFLEDEGDDDDDDYDDFSANLVERWPISGFPKSAEEAMLGLIQAGFEPDKNAFMQLEIKWFIDMIFRRAADKFSIQIEKGKLAWCIPG